jgi:hypothetical protein
MVTTATLEKTLRLLDAGYTFPSITDETGITTEDAEAVHVAWFKGTSEQLLRELRLTTVLKLGRRGRALARDGTKTRRATRCATFHTFIPNTRKGRWVCFDFNNVLKGASIHPHRDFKTETPIGLERRKLGAASVYRTFDKPCWNTFVC